MTFCGDSHAWNDAGWIYSNYTVTTYERKVPMQQFPARNLRRLLALGLALLALSACAPNVPSSDPNTENGNVDTQNPPTSDTPIDPADTTAAPAAPT